MVNAGQTELGDNYCVAHQPPRWKFPLSSDTDVWSDPASTTTTDLRDPASTTTTDPRDPASTTTTDLHDSTSSCTVEVANSPLSSDTEDLTSTTDRRDPASTTTDPRDPASTTATDLRVSPSSCTVKVASLPANFVAQCAMLGGVACHLHTTGDVIPMLQFDVSGRGGKCMLRAFAFTQHPDWITRSRTADKLATDPELRGQEQDVVAQYEELIRAQRLHQSDLVREFDHTSIVPAWNGPLELQLLCDGLNIRSPYQIGATVNGPSDVLGTNEREFKPLFSTREHTLHHRHLVHTRIEGREDPELGGHFSALIAACDVDDVTKPAETPVLPNDLRSNVLGTPTVAPLSSPLLAPIVPVSVHSTNTNGAREVLYGRTQVQWDVGLPNLPVGAVLWCSTTLIGEVVGIYWDGDTRKRRIIVAVFLNGKWDYIGKGPQGQRVRSLGNKAVNYSLVCPPGVLGPDRCPAELKKELEAQFGAEVKSHQSATEAWLNEHRILQEAMQMKLAESDGTAPTVESPGDPARSIDTGNAVTRTAAIQQRRRSSTEAPIVRKSFRVATAKAVLSSRSAIENAMSLSSRAESEDNSDFAVVAGPKPKRKRAPRVTVKLAPENTDKEQPVPRASTTAGPRKRKPLESVTSPPPKKHASILAPLRADSASTVGQFAVQPGVQVVPQQSVGDQLISLLPFLERVAGLFRPPVPVIPTGVPSAGSVDVISIDVLERLGRIGGLLHRPT